MLQSRSWLTACLVALANLSLADRPIEITFLHSNDLHAHMDGATIQKKAYGGYARQATIIKRIRSQESNVLLLNAGDTFQGTLYFSTYEGLADLAFMNAVHYDVACLGNHEFDRGPGTLSSFVGHATFPVLCANLDFTKEPALRELVQPSAVLIVGGEKVGVVGAVTPDVFNISNPGPNVSLKDLKLSMQAAIDDLTKRGINKIVLLTHIGYGEDKQLVSQLHDVDLVVGGHSHTPLGTPDLPGWPKAVGPYPTMAMDSTGQAVPIVQCWEWSKVFGHIRVQFDRNGKLVKVLDAKPIVVDESIPEDPQVAELIAAFQKPITKSQNQPVGSSTTGLPDSTSIPFQNPIADVIADAMKEASAKFNPVAAFINLGGVRSPINPGVITYGQAVAVQPFNNTLTILELSGAEVKAALEEGVADLRKSGGVLNPSQGTSYRIDFSKPAGSRISNVVLGGLPLDLGKKYSVCFLNFTANGGDSHVVLKEAKGKRTETGIVDIEGLVAYLKAHSPVDISRDLRIVAVGGG